MFRTHYSEEEKLWRGDDLTPLFNPKISLGEILFRSLLAHRSRIAQISDDSDTQMTFDDIRIKATRAAQNLQRLGYKPENIIGIMARNSKDVAPIMFATLFLGCPLNTFDPNFFKKDFLIILNKTKPSVFFCDINVYDMVRQSLNELQLKIQIYTFGGVTADSKNVESLFIENDDKEYQPFKLDGETSTALIICSSGTSGAPKSMCLSHAMLADYFANTYITNSDDTILYFSTLHWITAFREMFNATFCGAKRIITTEAFSPEMALRLIEKHKVTYVICPPYQAHLLVNSEQIHWSDLSTITKFCTGGNYVPIDLPKQLNKYLRGGKNVHVLYGLTEVAGPLTADYPESGKNGTVGRLCAGTWMKIIDENGNRCGPNVNGEICIKPRYKFLGYYGNEEATRSAVDDEGFVVTGDIGRFDDDGDLFVIDRKKDMIRYHGFPITTIEIEDFLLKHPDVHMACVVGIPDGYGNCLPAAAIKRNENATLTEQEIIDLVANNFDDHYKLRCGVYFVDSIPISSSGKILKREIRAKLEELYERK